MKSMNWIELRTESKGQRLTGKHLLISCVCIEHSLPYGKVLSCSSFYVTKSSDYRWYKNNKWKLHSRRD